MKPEKKKNKHQIQLLRPTRRDNSPIQDYVHPDDHTQPTFEMTPGFLSQKIFRNLDQMVLGTFLFAHF